MRQAVDVATTPGETILSVVRPFNWGGVLVMDSATADIGTEADERGVVRSTTCLGFMVRHAHDVETASSGPFQVAVDVRWGPPTGEVAIEHLIDVTSGSMTIGDADEEEVVSIAGRCLVSVALDSDLHAERATIWLTPEETLPK